MSTVSARSICRGAISIDTDCYVSNYGVSEDSAVFFICCFFLQRFIGTTRRLIFGSMNSSGRSTHVDQVGGRVVLVEQLLGYHNVHASVGVRRGLESKLLAIFPSQLRLHHKQFWHLCGEEKGEEWGGGVVCVPRASTIVRPTWCCSASCQFIIWPRSGVNGEGRVLS